jgi:hypothetical protein
MRVLVLALLCSSWCVAGELPKNWAGPYAPCAASSELLKYKSMDLGVQFATSNPLLAAQFRAALNFWSTVIDMRWHTARTSLCAVELLDGEPQLFADSTIAKSHLSERSGFQGWIAFNPKAPLTDEELFLTAVHEIGHLLGLPHNPDVASIMYYTNREGSDVLDTADLLSLAGRHKLRAIGPAPIRCVNADFPGEPAMTAFSSFRRRLFFLVH